MDIGDLLQLERAFQGNRIIDPSSDKEHILCRKVTVCKFLDPVLVIQEELNLIRKPLQVFDIVFHLCIRNLSSYLCKFDGKKIQCDKLAGVRLCSRHCDLRPCPGIHHIICLPGNGTPHYIYDAKHLGAFLLRFSERRK